MTVSSKIILNRIKLCRTLTIVDHTLQWTMDIQMWSAYQIISQRTCGTIKRNSKLKKKNVKLVESDTLAKKELDSHKARGLVPW